MTGAAPDYQFFICDHLGSTRVVASAAGQALQSNEYYPFGGMIVRNVPDSSHFDIDDSGVNPLADDFLNEEHFAEDDEISLAHSDQPYKFSGKEFIEDNGLNLYNFGARFYNPVNCRFTTMDPLAEKYFSISPYAYCNNNPIIFVDPDGKFFETLWDISNVAMDVKSLYDNVSAGKIGAALVDGVSLALDAASVVLPGIPGGIGASVKAIRG